MKHQILFIQGAGAHTHDQWDNKLVDSLQRALGPDYEIRYPLMPNEAEPDFAKWSAKLQNELSALREGAVVVGHSMGGTILINMLANYSPNVQLGAIFLLAAPFVGDGGWPADGWTPPRDLGSTLPVDAPVHVYHGLADDTAPPSHADLYALAIPEAVITRLPERDHQLNNDLREVAEAIKVLKEM